MDNATLKKLQTVEEEILSFIDEFCKEHTIKYSLYGGTLLGAVRHKGFIPWDDDIDIVMTRSEYTKFFNIWQNESVKEYYLESIETDDYTQNVHTKIRKNGTLLLSAIENEKTGHHGIWIDIFILDKISNDKKTGHNIIKAGQKLILLAKANGRFPGEGIRKRFARTILRGVFPNGRRKRLIKGIIEVLNNNEKTIEANYELCDMCTLDYLKIRFPQATGQGYTQLQFGEKFYPSFDNYDEILRIMYGDYMQLPPAKDRICKHNPSKIKLE